MRPSPAVRMLQLKSVLSSTAFRLVRPVVLVGIANALLFFSVDRTQMWTVATAALGMVLLAVVLTRQLGEILGLERVVEARARQLEVVSGVITTLHASPHVGGSLGPVLDQLMEAMDAEAGAIWLPGANGRLSLVEQRGLPPSDALLEDTQRATGSSREAIVRHPSTLPDGTAAHCLTARMGREGEEFGYLTLVARGHEFSEAEATILTAIGSDISAALRSVRMLSEARRLADRDPVTGLLNHRSAYQRLHAEVERNGAAGKPMAVLMMDLDNFKLFNDTYGHPAGDEVLKRVGSILSRACRQNDIVARYGGDEFIVILPEANLKQAVKCAERIQATLAKERFRCQDSATLPIGFSYGISVFPDDTRDALELVSVADTNLYRSKTQGGNQITTGGDSKTDNSLIYVKGFDLFRAMVSAIDNKDGYTRQHSEEVTEYSMQIARGLELPDETVQSIQLAGVLHDVGKIGVPDTILRKPGKLTDEEFHVMKQHPEFGALIVGAMPGMEHVVLGVRHHHERYDGLGYPDRLRGEEIPLIGRIMAIADAFSAMTTSRPYRKGLTERQALTEIKRGLGTQFDPELGQLFVRLREARLAEKAAQRPRRAKAAAPPPAEPAAEGEEAPAVGAAA